MQILLQGYGSNRQFQLLNQMCKFCMCGTVTSLLIGWIKVLYTPRINPDICECFVSEDEDIQ